MTNESFTPPVEGNPSNEESAEAKRKVALMRHLPRDKDFQPTEEGREAAKLKAKELISELEAMPMGSVMIIVPSIVPRNVLTRDIFERELKEHYQGNEHVRFISLSDAERSRDSLEQAKGNFDNKFVITDATPQTLLGYTETNLALPAFKKYLQMFDGDEELTGKFWLASSEEQQQMKDEITKKVPGIDTEVLYSGDFVLTPEDFARNYILSIKRMHDLAERYFPHQLTKVVNITHDFYSDFATMALMGKELNLKSFEEFGSTFRNFLESTEIEFHEEQIVVKYRDQVVAMKKSLEEMLQDLEVFSRKRKEDWSQQD
ncbi:MAG: hypothetical protein IPJ68_03285 [Candidatus Moraniibacteriota bacterium]|nr:MAG: hypothetical protein IPJ68_03285 [Candidatus Moranbacteria bacterium]